MESLLLFWRNIKKIYAEIRMCNPDLMVVWMCACDYQGSQAELNT